MRIKYYEKIKQKTWEWGCKCSLTHLRASTIHKIFKKLYYKNNIYKNISYRERIDLKNKLDNYEFKIYKKKKKDDTNDYVQYLYDRGNRGEEEIIKRLFSNNKNILLGTYFELEYTLNIYNLRISVSPDIIFKFINDLNIIKIPIEIKTRCDGNNEWPEASIESIYQLMTQCIACKSKKGFIMRLNYDRNNPKWKCKAQLFKIEFKVDLEENFKNALLGYIYFPGFDYLYFYERNFFKEELIEIDIPPYSMITDEFLFKFYNILLQ